jgi:uncharacterized coiled-coil DUF342 family protein
MTDPTAEIRATVGDTSALQGVRDRYKHLCALRDGANKKCGDLQSKLDAANLRAEAARREAEQHAAAIQNIRGGGENWLALKKEIGQLARLLGGQ